MLVRLVDPGSSVALRDGTARRLKGPQPKWDCDDFELKKSPFRMQNAVTLDLKGEYVQPGVRATSVKSRLDDALEKKFCRSVRKGSGYESACDAVGISRRTFYNWIRKGRNAPASRYGQFERAVRKAKVAADDAQWGWVNGLSIQTQSWIPHAEHAGRKHAYPPGEGQRIMSFAPFMVTVTDGVQRYRWSWQGSLSKTVRQFLVGYSGNQASRIKLTIDHAGETVKARVRCVNGKPVAFELEENTYRLGH